MVRKDKTVVSSSSRSMTCHCLVRSSFMVCSCTHTKCNSHWYYSIVFFPLYFPISFYFSQAILYINGCLFIDSCIRSAKQMRENPDAPIAMRRFIVCNSQIECRSRRLLRQGSDKHNTSRCFELRLRSRTKETERTRDGGEKDGVTPNISSPDYFSESRASTRNNQNSSDSRCWRTNPNHVARNISAGPWSIRRE